MKQWYNVELNHEDAKKLKFFLKSNNIYFEPSSCYNLIHFEIKLDEAGKKLVDEFLETL